jgi:hypothetical protein
MTRFWTKLAAMFLIPALVAAVWSLLAVVVSRPQFDMRVFVIQFAIFLPWPCRGVAGIYLGDAAIGGQPDPREARRFLAGLTALALLAPGAVLAAIYAVLASPLMGRVSPPFSALPYLTGGLAVAYAAAALAFTSYWQASPYHRGALVQTASTVRRRLARHGFPSPADPGIPFGSVHIPSAAAVLGFIYIGAIGAGKSTLLRALLRHVLGQLGPGQDCRVLITDASRDMVSWLSRQGLRCRVVLMNPFDRRGRYWAIAQDVTDRAAAKAVAHVLIPDTARKEPFFETAARALLEAVLVTFVEKCPGRWTFSDVIYVLRNRERLLAVLALTPDGRDAAALYFANDKTSNDVMAELANKTSEYALLAAAWAHCPPDRGFSLREWVEDGGVLILGSSQEAPEATRAMTEVLVKRLSQMLLQLPPSRTRRNWFFLDELRSLGKLPGLRELIVEGRKYGNCVVGGIQSLDGWTDALGSKEVCNELIDQFGSLAILRCSGNTAKWASEYIGKREILRRTTGGGPQGSNWHDQIVAEAAAMTEEFQATPPASPDAGVHGYFFTPAAGFWWAVVADAFDPDGFGDSPAAPDFVPRPPDHQILVPWTRADLDRLGLDLNLDTDGPEPPTGPVPTPAPRPRGPRPPLRVVGRTRAP